jgi:hypothetical protein
MKKLSDCRVLLVAVSCWVPWTRRVGTLTFTAIQPTEALLFELA